MNTIQKTATGTFAAFGAAALAFLITSFVMDGRAFDRTSGGYEPPYTGFVGEPIDWNDLDVTRTGMAKRGNVVKVLIDCTSGMMTFEAFGLHVLFRKFSERAHAVHNPREACEERGFEPII